MMPHSPRPWPFTVSRYFVSPLRLHCRAGGVRQRCIQLNARRDDSPEPTLALDSAAIHRERQPDHFIELHVACVSAQPSPISRSIRVAGLSRASPVWVVDGRDESDEQWSHAITRPESFLQQCGHRIVSLASVSLLQQPAASIGTHSARSPVYRPSLHLGSERGGS